MKKHQKILFLSLMGVFLLFSHGTTAKAETPDTLLMYPIDLGEKAKKDLTPQQQRELQINEDNVMNPFPG